MTALTWGQRGDNLPAEVTRFIGRRRELPTIAEAIARHRLVTLRGTGGVGKTRLALRTAIEHRDSFADGCWMVQLSPLHTPDLLVRAVSEALGLPDEAAAKAPLVLAESLAERELLLVLDTCEHLTEACAELATLLLAAAPGLRILATSRAPLGLPDEHSLLITPLELPTDDTTAAYSDAVTLFVDRARAAVPDFVLTPENTPAVAELCRRLEGIPLVLELAAVRLRGMPVEEILARLSDRFRVLGTARTATDRHRTLRAAVSWSYELCSPDEQRLWAALSVFPGSFRLAAAEHVCGPGIHEPLERLVEKSVVQLPSSSAFPRDTADLKTILADIQTLANDRYQLLDTMREFGADRLDPAEAARLRARHRDYYLSLAERAAAGYITADQEVWLAKLGVETANLRVALDYSLTAPDEAQAGARMTRLLLPYWLMTGQFTEGRRWHDLALPGADKSRDSAWSLFGAGVLAVQQGDFATAEPLLAEAAVLAEEGADEDLAVHVMDARGMLAFYSGDLVTAQAEFEAALAAYERNGFSDPAALVTYSRLASVCLLTFDLDRAVKLSEECLRRCEELGEQWARGTALWTRGVARWMSGDNATATEDALACLRIKEQLGDLHTIAMSFDLLTLCQVSDGDCERAAVLHGASRSLWTLLNAPLLMGPAYKEIVEGAAATARSLLGEERFAALVRYGCAIPLPAALAVARGEAPAGPATEPAPGTEVKPLTRREKEIAALVAGGMGNRQIAELLFLSKRTVDSHVEHIFTKLGFSSRTQLTSWILESGSPA
ncbi:MAG TPA: LuxR C-terminal-related transcriptional regulator [Trebonia sp.]|nr:LuxR C-terminal-related transcriptional regulator [Trebonia sp.]